MPTNTKTFNVPLPPSPSVPLKGYLVKEDPERLWIQDFQGTWIVNDSDVVGRGEWTGVGDTRFSGKPGLFYIRDGAEIQSVRAVTVKAVRDWPLAIGEAARVSEIADLPRIETLPIDEMGLEMRSAVRRPRPKYTYCKGPDGRMYICDNRLE